MGKVRVFFEGIFINYLSLRAEPCALLFIYNFLQNFINNCKNFIQKFKIVNLIIGGISANISEGKAKGCIGSDDFWIDNDKLVIYKISTKAIPLEILSVNVNNQFSCVDEEGKDKSIVISKKDADFLELQQGDKVQAQFR